MAAVAYANKDAAGEVKIKRAARSNLEEKHNDLFGSSGFDWSDSDVVKFADNALEEKLSILEDGRGSKEEITDTLLWVAEPMVPEHQLKYHPTSFQAMCALSGYDAEFLQYEILRIKAPRLCKHLGLEPDDPFHLESHPIVQRLAY